MADFDRAYGRTQAIEGGYSNRAADRGGETYRGISRKRWPLWSGWEKIDAVKNDPGFPKIIDYIGLEKDIKHFYRIYFWDPLHGDMNPIQAVADKLFDFGVNAGVATVIRFMQESLNVLNLKGLRWPDLEVDGKAGPETLRAFATCCLKHKYQDVLLTMFTGRMINHYYTIMCNDVTQEENAIGWLRRAALS